MTPGQGHKVLFWVAVILVGVILAVLLLLKFVPVDVTP